MSVYAQRIREIRQIHNLTQPQFAERIGTTKNQISKYELNKEPIPVKHIIKICKEFCVSADWLLGIEQDVEYLKKVHEIRNLAYALQKDKEKTIAMIKAMHLDNEDELIAKVLSIDIQEG